MTGSVAVTVMACRRPCGKWLPNEWEAMRKGMGLWIVSVPIPGKWAYQAVLR